MDSWKAPPPLLCDWRKDAGGVACMALVYIVSASSPSR